MNWRKNIRTFIREFIVDDGVSDDVPFLGDAELSSNASVAEAAAIVLCASGPQTLEDGLTLWSRLRPEARVDEVALAILDRAGTDSTLAAAIRFIASLPEDGPAEYVSELISRFESHSCGEIRLAVGELVLVRPSRECTECKLRFLVDASDRVREIACAGLSVTVGDDRKRAVQAVRGALSDPVRAVRVCAVGTLLGLEASLADVPTEVIAEFLSDDVSNVHYAERRLRELTVARLAAVLERVGGVVDVPGTPAGSVGTLEEVLATLKEHTG